MAVVQKNRQDDYIVVHHVFGERDVIDYLRMTSRVILDRIFFEAKSHGEAEFRFRNRPYRVTWTKAELYDIVQLEDDGMLD